MPRPRSGGSARSRPVLGEHPTAFAYLLEAFERLVTPPLEVAIVGAAGDPATIALRAEVGRRLLPASVRVVAAPCTGEDLTPLLADRGAVDGEPDRLRVRALRLSSARHRSRRPPRAARRGARRAPLDPFRRFFGEGGYLGEARPSASASAIAQP